MAIENQVYIIAVNCVGEIGGVTYSGNSCVINPNGEIMINLSGQEGLLEYQLSDNVDNFRNRFQVKHDRKENLYFEFMNDRNIRMYRNNI